MNIVNEALIKEYVELELTSTQLQAIISLVTDIGILEFLNSNLLRYLNTGNIYLASKQFINYAQQGRIVSVTKLKQRQYEKELFLTN